MEEMEEMEAVEEVAVTYIQYPDTTLERDREAYSGRWISLRNPNLPPRVRSKNTIGFGAVAPTAPAVSTMLATRRKTLICASALMHLGIEFDVDSFREADSHLTKSWRQAIRNVCREATQLSSHVTSLHLSGVLPDYLSWLFILIFNHGYGVWVRLESTSYVHGLQIHLPHGIHITMILEMGRVSAALTFGATSAWSLHPNGGYRHTGPGTLNVSHMNHLWR